MEERPSSDAAADQPKLELVPALDEPEAVAEGEGEREDTLDGPASTQDPS
jgi:hypothetical protein